MQPGTEAPDPEEGKRPLPEARSRRELVLNGEGALETEELVTELQTFVERHAGPLPHPETLHQYAVIDPRAVEWILDSASREQAHRHWCEREPLLLAGRAQWFAFVIGILVVLVGGFLLYADKSVAGLATIMVPLATLLGVFVYKEVRSAQSDGDS